MPTRQYIGARYVPKFYTNSVDGSTQWEPNVVYEPLMYVTLTNAHMYISKKQVPATVGSPVDNINYWLDIGSYNGFIDNLQQQIDNLVTDLENVDDKIIVDCVDNFGAVGDGVTDDTAAFTTAFGKVKILYLSPNKTYVISSAITMPKGSMLCGGGTIKVTGSNFYNAIVMDDDCTVKDISIIDGYSTYDIHNVVIYGEGVKNVKVEGVKLTNIHVGYCIRFDNSQFIDIVDNKINECSYCGIMLLNGCYDANICNNDVYNCRKTSSDNKYPISISGYMEVARDVARRIKCNYNRIQEVTAEWEGIDCHGAIECEIIGNEISGVRYGIAMGSGATSASANALPAANQNITIKSNHIEFVNPNSSYGYGIFMNHNGHTTDAAVSGIIIENNIIKSSGEPSAYSEATSCISVRGRNGCKIQNVVINNNKIISKNNGIAVGTLDTGSITEEVAITNNFIDGNGSTSEDYSAIFLRYLGDEYLNIKIENNHSYHFTNGNDIYGPATADASSNMVDYLLNYTRKQFRGTDYITTPRSSFNTSHAYGRIGQTIYDTSGVHIAWVCIAPGNWKALA